MNILWLSHLVPYPPKGGALQRSYNLLKEVSRYHDVHLLAFVQQALVERSALSLQAGLSEASDHLSGFCRSVRFVPIPSEKRKTGRKSLLVKSFFTPDPYTINWLKSAEMAAAIRQRLEDRSIALVHFDTISLAVYLRLIDGPKTVLNHHNVESHMMLRRAKKEKNPLLSLYLNWEGRRLAAYEKRMCGRFDANITCSELDNERLCRVVPGIAPVAVPNGVDTDYFRPDPEAQEPRTLLFAGRLGAYANRQAARFIARELWPVLKNRIPGIRFDLVGSDPPPEAVALAGRDQAFGVHGFVDDVRPYLNRAALYLCPITDGGGTRLKILDALAMQKAIVADPMACEGIDVTDGETVRFAHTPEAYAAQVETLLADAGARQDMGQAARELVEEKYACRAIGKQLSDLYETVARKP